ncbi:MAG: M13 family metallopeptidase [Marinicella sp.]
MNKTLLTLAICLLSSCANQTTQTETTTQSSGIHLENFSTKVRPQDDFYHYVNGRWLEEFEIPADKSYYGTSSILKKKIETQIQAIINEVAQHDQQPGSAEQKIADLYRAYMDTEAIEARGINSLTTEFQKIDAIQNTADLSEYFGYADVFSRAPISFYVYLDDKNSDQYIIFMDQSGLGLPDRDYYLETDEQHTSIQKKYITHIGNMLSLAGIANAQTKAQKIYTLEQFLAKGHWDSVNNNDMEKTYNKMQFEELSSLVPQINWNAWLTHAMIDKPENLVVFQPSYLETVNTAIKETPLDTWKAYFKWHLLSNYAAYLSTPFADEDFSFFGTVMSGKTAQSSRSQRAVDLVNRKAGELVGKLYVKQHFPEEAKIQVLQMVEHIREAYAKSIRNLDWMSNETKTKALEKLAKLSVKIGYPDVWRDYSELDIHGNDLVAMIKETRRFYVHRGRSKLGQPVNRTEWFMNPQSVNAYLDPARNEMVFLAGILQPPYFNFGADVAVNYGGIGAIIGHEMGHAFDDAGSQYDSDGNRNNWWTDEDLKSYQMRIEPIIAQYNAFTVVDGTPVNGEMTQGENLSDLTGLSIAYRAFKANYPSGSLIDGFTPEQRFFISRAQVRMRKYRDEELLQQIKTNYHAPAEFRVNGVMKNMPEFYEAFDVQPGDGMFLPEAERIKVW